MKTLFATRALLLLSFLSPFSILNAQSTIFWENAGRSTVAASPGTAIGSYTGWTHGSSATLSGTGTVALTENTSALTTNLSSNTNGNTTGASGSGADINLVRLASGQTFIIDGLNTSSYTVDKLIFNARKSSGVSLAYSNLRVELQAGGSGWVAFTTSTSPALMPSSAECNVCWDFWTLNVPATLNGVSTSNSNLQIRFTNTTGSSRFFEIDDVLLTGHILLPLRLTRLEAERSDRATHVRWWTAEESNVDYFAVERSDNGHLFYSIAQVAARNSGSPESYSVEDKALLTGRTWYRLRSMDLDGSSSLSQTVALQANGNLAGLQLARNPARGAIELRAAAGLRGRFRYTISTAGGQRVQDGSLTIESAGRYSIPFGTTPQAGMFLIELEAPGHAFAFWALVE